MDHWGFYRTQAVWQFLSSSSMNDQDARAKVQELVTSLERHIVQLEQFAQQSEELAACQEALGHLKELLEDREDS
jgi:hypothetical protein